MGQAIEITHCDHTAADLREVAARTRDGRVVRRLLAVALVLDGQSRAEAAQTCGMDRQTLRDWVHRFNASGAAGLSDKPVPGRPPRLTGEQKAELKRVVLGGPDPDKDGVVRWRCCDLKRVVAERFGVNLHEPTIGKLLHQLGLVRLQPRPAHPGKDAEAEVAFKKTLPKRPEPLLGTALAASR